MALDPALHVAVAGPALPAATVVFVHGIGDNHETWELQRAALDSTSVRHVAYDHRGFGRSQARTTRRVTITDLARDLGSVIDDQPDAPIILVGHSMGTMTIQALAAARPDLFLSRVTGVLLLAGPGAGREIAGGVPLPVARVVSGSVRRGLFLAAGLPSRSPLVRGIVALMVEAAYGPRGDRTMRAAVRTRVAGVSTRTLVTHVDACLTFHAPTSPAVLDRVPTVVVVAGKDRLCAPAGGRSLAAAIPSSELVEIAESGHMVQHEYADEVNDLVGRLVAAASMPVSDAG